MEDLSIDQQLSTRILRYRNPPYDLLTAAGAQLILDAVTAAIEDSTVRVIILTGYEDIFIRHFDVTEIMGAAEALNRGQMTTDSLKKVPLMRMMTVISETAKPVIAAINGTCMGGGFELALACDIRVASESVDRIGLPETRIGIFPGAGGTQRLAHLIGEGAALNFILRGQVVDSLEAKQLGLVHDLAGDALTAALEVAKDLASKTPESLATVKRLVRGANSWSLSDGLKHEQRELGNILQSDNTIAELKDFLASDEPLL